MKVRRLVYCLAVIVWLVSPDTSHAQEEIDASDPTKIYSYAGPGVKYTEYTNGESMSEIRASGNVGLGASDMVLFELGYGWHSQDKAAGKTTSLTNARARWFHLFPMDYSVVSGYRGLGTQVDVQLEGDIIGTNASNTISVGGLAAFGISGSLSAYLALNAVMSWTSEFEKYNGTGGSIAPLLVFAPSGLWPGAFFQLWPAYTYFFSGEIKDSGSANIDFVIGASLTSTLIASVTFQKFLDQDLKSYPTINGSRLIADWNAFLTVSLYF